MTAVPFQEKNHYRYPPGDMQAREREWLDGLPLSARCFFCGAVFEGTAAGAREWAREHRTQEHPQARDRGQAARRAAAKKAPTVYGRFNDKVER